MALIAQQIGRQAEMSAMLDVFQLMTWSFLVVATIRNGCFFDLRGWGKLFYWLWINPGTLRAQFLRYWQYFRPGFHPWEIDNYHQVERWKSVYADATPAPR